jgi:hypothetical protein
MMRRREFIALHEGAAGMVALLAQVKRQENTVGIVAWSN